MNLILNQWPLDHTDLVSNSKHTVNSEIFVRVLFSRNFTYAKCVKIRPARNGEITLSFTYANHAVVANF